MSTLPKYLLFCAYWAVCWLAPQFVGDWYDDHFQLYQAAVSLSLLVAAVCGVRAWWCKELGMVLILQMLLNAGDYFWPMAAEAYNAASTALNRVELGIIILLGGGTYAVLGWRSYRAANRGRMGAGGQRKAEQNA